MKADVVDGVKVKQAFCSGQVPLGFKPGPRLQGGTQTGTVQWPRPTRFNVHRSHSLPLCNHIPHSAPSSINVQTSIRAPNSPPWPHPLPSPLRMSLPPQPHSMSMTTPANNSPSAASSSIRRPSSSSFVCIPSGASLNSLERSTIRIHTITFQRSLLVRCTSSIYYPHTITLPNNVIGLRSELPSTSLRLESLNHSAPLTTGDYPPNIAICHPARLGPQRSLGAGEYPPRCHWLWRLAAHQGLLR